MAGSTNFSEKKPIDRPIVQSGYFISVVEVQPACTLDMRALPPTYVRAVILRNTCTRPVNLIVQFESVTDQTHVVEVGATTHLDHGLDKGGWTAVDPLKSIAASLDGAFPATTTTTQTFVSDFGVAIFNVELTSSNDDGQITFSVSRQAS